MITPDMLKKRPDQVAYQLNVILDELDDMKRSIVLKSEDGSVIMILGQQPINPATNKPYPFGIHQYRVLGDRLEEI